MKKLFAILLLTGISITTANAEPLILSDIIQQARDAQMQIEAKEKAELAMMKPIMTKNQEEIQHSCEQSAAEKINPNEFINQDINE